jgi:hypothetical protein
MKRICRFWFAHWAAYRLWGRECPICAGLMVGEAIYVGMLENVADSQNERLRRGWNERNLR